MLSYASRDLGVGEATGFDPDAYKVRYLPLRGRFRFLGYAAVRALNRINRLADLSYVIEVTPRRVPFARGLTYRPLLWKLVPRLVWKGAPREDPGRIFARMYASSWSTNNLPMVTEAWMNGGWVVVILSALFVGLVLRTVWVYWIGGSGAPGNVMIGMAVVATAVNGESNLSSVMGGVIHALLVYWIIEVVIRAWGSRAPALLRPAAPVWTSRG